MRLLIHSHTTRSFIQFNSICASCLTWILRWLGVCSRGLAESCANWVYRALFAEIQLSSTVHTIAMNWGSFEWHTNHGGAFFSSGHHHKREKLVYGNTLGAFFFQSRIHVDSTNQWLIHAFPWTIESKRIALYSDKILKSDEIFKINQNKKPWSSLRTGNQNRSINGHFFGVRDGVTWHFFCWLLFIRCVCVVSSSNGTSRKAVMKFSLQVQSWMDNRKMTKNGHTINNGFRCWIVINKTERKWKQSRINYCFLFTLQPWLLFRIKSNNSSLNRWPKLVYILIGFYRFPVSIPRFENIRCKWLYYVWFASPKLLEIPSIAKTRAWHSVIRMEFLE